MHTLAEQFEWLEKYVKSREKKAVIGPVLGEPARWHPLVGFGRLAGALERGLRRGAPGAAVGSRLPRFAGLGPAGAALAASLRMVGLAQLAWPAELAGHALLLWFALGGRSLEEHAQAVAQRLAAGDLGAARERLSWMVSRETARLDAGDISRATVETALENGNDAVFGALFWAALMGGPGALAFRFANTLDAVRERVCGRRAALCLVRFGA